MREHIVFRVNGVPVSRASRERWMYERDLQFTLVCGESIQPTDLEMDLTECLDKILGRIYWRSGIRQQAQEIAKRPNLVLGQQAPKGKKSVQSAMGDVLDGQFKAAVKRALLPGGALSDLFVRAGGTRPILQTSALRGDGPDVVMQATRTAWDVTTFSQLGHHFKRDVLNRHFLRYYLLIYDSPGAVPHGHVEWELSAEEDEAISL